MKIVPNTVTIDMMCSALMIATAFSDVRIHSLKAEFCAASTSGVRSTLFLGSYVASSKVPRFPDLDIVGDRASEKDDHEPEHDRRDGDDACSARIDGARRWARCRGDGAAEIQSAR